ncbi:MAG TPA: hypothetical protein VGR91_10140 [Stellaceae bacterium]|nr:hypothetical protein [Stellaceae bacterium]
MSLDRFELAKQEYIKLKDEQTKRIGFRDNLLYVNLVLVAGIMSFAFAGGNHANRWQLHGLLIAGWVALVLGWTYLVNDEKISAIGCYIRGPLAQKLDPTSPQTLFGWEHAHRSDDHRKRRKIEQWVVDELSFPGIGLGATILFLMLPSSPGYAALFGAILEMILLLILGVEIFVYADFGADKDDGESSGTGRN